MLETFVMSTTLETSPSAAVAGEVRAHLARRGMSLTEFEQRLGVPRMWAIRRVGPSRSIDLTLEDATRIADALDVPLLDLLTP